MTVESRDASVFLKSGQARESAGMASTAQVLAPANSASQNAVHRAWERLSGSFSGERAQRPYWLWMTLAFGGFCAVVYGGFPYLVPGTPPPPWMPMWILYAQVGCLALCFILALIVRWAERLPDRWSWTVIFTSATIVALLSSLNSYQLVVWFERGNPAFQTDYIGGIGFSLTIDIWIYAFFAAAQKLLKKMELERARDAHLAEVKMAAGQAQLRALRYQVNPHFLFNTLNALSSLISSGRGEEAKLMMQQLNEYLRSTAGSETIAQTDLSEELAAIEAYLAIERVRFGSRLAVEIDCPSSLRNAEIPSLLLQPLIENAVKYGVAPSGDCVTISVRAAAMDGQLVLTIEDDGRVRKPARGLGVGHRNIANRLALLHASNAGLETELHDEGFRAVVRLPLALRVYPPAPANDIEATPLHIASGI